MRNKSIVLTVALALVLVFSIFAFAEGETAETGTGASVSVGGHIKMTVFDMVHAISKNGAVRQNIDRFYGVNFKELDLFISGKMNDWIGFEVDPRFSASTGATPKLGTTTTAAGKDFSFNSFGHGKAVVTFDLPADVHLEVGQIHPIFTMEYGKELWWEDEFNVGPFIGSSGPAGAYHDSGIEASKAFELGDVTLPVYLYYLNGYSTAGAADNNNQPGGMIHVEPAWGPLTVSGSFYAKKGDNEERYLTYGWTAGLAVKWEGLTVRSEYAKGSIQDDGTYGKDRIEEGYFVKVLYKVLPWLQLMATHESDQDYIGIASKNVRYMKYAPGAQIFLTDSTIVEISCDIFNHSMMDQSKYLYSTRPSINLRVTF